MNKLFVVLFFIVLMQFVSPEIIFAQPPPPALPVGPDQAPIDGGLGLLVLGGGAYAFKKLKRKKEQSH